MYRNSEEEQAQVDPQQKCTKEIKVQLCDAKNAETRSTALKDDFGCKTDLHHSKNGIAQSIKTAKQAIENLQLIKHFRRRKPRNL